MEVIFSMSYMSAKIKFESIEYRIKHNKFFFHPSLPGQLLGDVYQQTKRMNQKGRRWAIQERY